MAGSLDHGMGGGAAVAEPPSVTTEEFERATAELSKRVDELGTQVANLGTRVTSDVEPHIRNVEGRLDALTTEVGALATLRVDFDTRMRAEVTARDTAIGTAVAAETRARATTLRDVDTAQARFRTEVVGWVGDRRGRLTTLTEDADAARRATNAATATADGARNWGQFALALAVVLLFVGGWGFFKGFPGDRAARTQTALAQIVGEMGGLDTSKPVGQQLLGWHQNQDRLESVEGTTLALADEANKIARSAEVHRVKYGLDKPLPPENVLYGWKDDKGRWHLGAMEQANNAQATAYRVGEAADTKSGIDPKESRADHYALAENPFGNRAGDLDKDSDPVKAYRAKRR